jgi:two-component system NtrC family sensor kinase
MTPVLAAANSTASEPSLQPASGLLPLVFQDEPIGWIVLSYKAEQPLKQVDPPTLQQVTTLTTAFVVWLREQVQREQHAQRSVRMLLQHTYQQRSSAISDLAAGLAHELHSPVGAIIGEVERLRGISVLPEAADSAIAVIATQARQINEAVMCLTNFSQTAVTTRVPVPLNDVLQNALTVVSGTAKQRGAKLECILPEQSPTVLANPGQIHRVCLELLSNALDAVEGTEQAVVSVEITIDDRWALIRINDNGYGIPDDLQERIFAPGYTTKSVGSSRQGQGIGLPMALGIARQHGGTIIVQSQIWAGSCFTLKLPLL